MHILVNRLLQDGDTISAVEINGRLKYYGLEPPACIAEGTYPVTWYNSPDHGFYVPLVNNVPGHAGIEIHVGNVVADTKDCLLLGENIATLKNIANSKAAINEFYPELEADIKAGVPCTITYKNLF